MRAFLPRGLAALVALVALAACSDATAPAPAPAALRAERAQYEHVRHVDEYTFDVTDRWLFLGCTEGEQPEPVRLVGTIVERVTSMQSPTGAIFYRRDERDRDLAGVGTVSGHAYDVERRLHDADRYADFGVLGNHRETWIVRDRVTGDVVRHTYRVHYAMDAERDLITDRQWETVQCR